MSQVVRQLKELARIEIDETRKQRSYDAINNARRGFSKLAVLKYSEHDVERIGSKLKSKGLISNKDLTDLLYALNEHESHISAFFKVNGALHGLVKELTGSNAIKQLLSIGCICNLASGPPRSNILLAKSAGTYLVTYLHQSQNKNLLELCAWALGNIIASSEKASSLLRNQDIIRNLLPLLSNNNELEVKNAAAYAISQSLISEWNILEDDHIEEITKILATDEIKSTQMLWLLYLLSDKKAAQSILLSNSVLKTAISCLISTVDAGLSTNLINVNCLVRIAANLSHPEVLSSDSKWLYNDNFVRTINTLLLCDQVSLVKETLWLLGNIYNIAPDMDEKRAFFSQISNSLNKSCSIISNVK